MFFKVTIPVPVFDCNKDEIEYLSWFFVGKASPSLERVRKVIEKELCMTAKVLKQKLEDALYALDTVESIPVINSTTPKLSFFCMLPTHVKSCGSIAVIIAHSCK